MVYPSTHLYVTAHWTAPGDEEGQCGFRTTDGVMPPDAALNNVVTAWSTFWNSANAAISVVYGLYRLKFALIDPSGHYPPGHVPVIKDFTVVPGSSANMLQPLQSAAVATLVGDLPRSPAGRGRMYLPPINKAVSTSTACWAALDAANRRGVVVDMLDSINTALAGSVAVFSEKGAGAVQEVAAVRQGDRPDVQRRRANKILETYTEEALA